jgi:hypothetical protein
MTRHAEQKAQPAMPESRIAMVPLKFHEMYPMNRQLQSVMSWSPNCVFDASLVPETCLEFPSLPV